MLRVEMTSTAFRGEGGGENLAQCRAFAEECGWDFGVQLHNTVGADEIARLAAAGIRLSAHGPLNALFNWNLAGEHQEAVRASIAENVELFRRLGIDMAVFHGFFMTDKPVPAFGHGRSYDECMTEILRPELLWKAGCRLNGNFFDWPEFLLRRSRVRENLAWIAREYPDVTFCIENDFPAYGAGNALPETAAALKNPLCVDSAHLWMSCRLYERDFLTEARKFFASGAVRMLHLHASKYDDTYPLENWSDGHLPLTYPNRMGLPEFVTAAIDADVECIVLEIVHGSVSDLHTLAAWLEEK